MPGEKIFENKVKAYLKNTDAWFVKYWAGAKYTKEGIPDILACVDGRFYGIEIKAKTGKPKLLQLINLRDIRRAGGYGILLYPDDYDMFICFVCDPEGARAWYESNIALQNKWFKKISTN